MRSHFHARQIESWLEQDCFFSFSIDHFPNFNSSSFRWFTRELMLRFYYLKRFQQLCSSLKTLCRVSSRWLRWIRAPKGQQANLWGKTQGLCSLWACLWRRSRDVSLWSLRQDRMGETELQAGPRETLSPSSARPGAHSASQHSQSSLAASLRVRQARWGQRGIQGHVICKVIESVISMNQHSNQVFWLCATC